MPVRPTGRPRRPVTPDSPPAVRELAVRLRELHKASGLTLGELSRLLPTHISTLSRASSGRIVPSWEIVEVFADGAQLDAPDRADLRLLWERAREQTGRSTEVPETAGAGSGSDPAHALLGHHQDFDRSAALMNLYQAAGAPSLRQLADESGHPRSTVHRAVTGRSLAGAANIAEALLSRLPEERRPSWAAEIKVLFGPPPAIPAPVPPPFEVKEGNATSQAHQALVEFRRALRELRNLVAHGDIELSPEIAHKVLLLQAELEVADATVTATAGSGKSETFIRGALNGLREEDQPGSNDHSVGDGLRPAKTTRSTQTDTGWEA
ncbi:helix-turn-helix domain-containing protein [Streptomyces geranii]|uniref:helix-turn-helix domain-containing protein n=1 Tax=Streptomyces geranii TaxID=2058923 RepID=UPI000D035AB7|nr:helix-turn-helix transcriptional regulator [Streptomyces geranii]